MTGTPSRRRDPSGLRESVGGAVKPAMSCLGLFSVSLRLPRKPMWVTAFPRLSSPQLAECL